MSNSFKDFAQQHKPLIDAQLLAAITGADYQSELLAEINQLVARGGKRLRPLICMLAYYGYGGDYQDAILPAAVSQELLHTFLLIHDDIIDRDDRRWGGPNIYGVYQQQYATTKSSEDALHFASSQALLAGDICRSLAGTSLLASQAAPGILLRAVKLQEQVSLQVLHGESLDVNYGLATSALTHQQILQMYRDKTASYTFSLPLQLGALLAGATESELTKLDDLATDLGLAFQLQDDMIGLFGNESETGKSNLSDLREGKRTPLTIEALQRATADDAQLLHSLLGDKTVTQKQLEQVQAIIKRSGALNAVNGLINDYSQSALDKIELLNINDNGKDLLRDMLKQFINRSQ